jgi:hypothetical protein
MDIIFWITVSALSFCIVFGFCIIFGAIAAFISEESEKFIEHGIRMFFYSFLLFSVIYLSNAYSNSGYDKGQKDAAMGKQKYTCLMDADMNKYVVEKK